MKWDRLEFEQIEWLRKAEQSPYELYDDVEHSALDRYTDVVPYKHNRVHLRVKEGHSDYINASHIILETTKSKVQLKYIATQVCGLVRPVPEAFVLNNEGPQKRNIFSFLAHGLYGDSPKRYYHHADTNA